MPDELPVKFKRAEWTGDSMPDEMPVKFKRAEWIGDGPLDARMTLGNADAWTPTQNREYQAAFDAQRIDIETSIARESPSEKERRLGWCGESAPDSAESVFDSYWPIKELEDAIQFEKGLIIGLEQARDRNENLLSESKLNVTEMQRQYAKLLEMFWIGDGEKHLRRNKVNVFMRTEVDAGGVSLCGPRAAARTGKRKAREDTEEQKVEEVIEDEKGCDFWDRNLSMGIAIIPGDLDQS